MHGPAAAATIWCSTCLDTLQCLGTESQLHGLQAAADSEVVVLTGCSAPRRAAQARRLTAVACRRTAAVACRRTAAVAASCRRWVSVRPLAVARCLGRRRAAGVAVAAAVAWGVCIEVRAAAGIGLGRCLVAKGAVVRVAAADVAAAAHTAAGGARR